MFSMRCLLLVRHALAVNPCNSGGNKAVPVAGISSSAAHWNSNYYEALGIPKGSTQNDIKAAYYRLSKQFHPDKNQGSESAAKKFREITQAYEVLGNYRLRRLYDKGIIHTAGSQYQAATMTEDIAPEVEDDDDTKFYKSRFTKSTVADIKGRTPIYDFDEWSRAHYGKSFNRRKNAKAKYDRTEDKKKTDILSAQNEIVFFSLIFCVGVMYAVFYAESSYDTPKERAIREAQEAAMKNYNKES